MRDTADMPSPEADPGRYESGELTPEEKQHEAAANADNTEKRTQEKTHR